jgi:rare lipoprotein A
MRRVLTQPMLLVLLTSALGAAPGHRSTDMIPALQPVANKGPEKPLLKKEEPYEVGRASWYGELFQGKETASGEMYNMQDYTAAHLKLPLGTWVRVTNLHNKKSVIVRINDRGPVVPGRIIDLSFKAAKEIGMKDRGLAKVRIDVVRPAPELQEVASAQTPEQYN